MVEAKGTAQFPRFCVPVTRIHTHSPPIHCLRHQFEASCRSVRALDIFAWSVCVFLLPRRCGETDLADASQLSAPAMDDFASISDDLEDDDDLVIDDASFEDDDDLDALEEEDDLDDFDDGLDIDEDELDDY